MGFLIMRILVFISIVIASVGLQSCNSTVKSVYRDDFRSASNISQRFHPTFDDNVRKFGKRWEIVW